MKKSSMYDGSTPRGLHLRAVVTATGDVVAKNYDSRKLIEESKKGEPGDVGLCVRLDGGTDALTPAQKVSLANQAQVMADALRRRAGIEVEAEWQAGMVVKATSDDTEVLGIVVSEDETTVRVKCFARDGRALKRVSLPKAMYMVEEVPGRLGINGLFFAITDVENADFERLEFCALLSGIAWTFELSSESVCEWFGRHAFQIHNHCVDPEPVEALISRVEDVEWLRKQHVSSQDEYMDMLECRIKKLTEAQSVTTDQPV